MSNRDRSTVIEFEPGWGIESYGVDGQLYGIRHKHWDGWKMAICTVNSVRQCYCGAVASDAMVAWLGVCRWKR